jgi:hypothetical protein
MAFADGAVLSAPNASTLSAPPVDVLPFAKGGIVNGGATNYSSVVNRFATGAIVSSNNSSISRFAYGGVLRADQAQEQGMQFTPRGLNDATTITDIASNNAAITVVQNIQTPDVAGFRRSRAAIFNDVQSALGNSVAKN